MKTNLLILSALLGGALLTSCGESAAPETEGEEPTTLSSDEPSSVSEPAAAPQKVGGSVVSKEDLIALFPKQLGGGTLSGEPFYISTGESSITTANYKTAAGTISITLNDRYGNPEPYPTKYVAEEMDLKAAEQTLKNFTLGDGLVGQTIISRKTSGQISSGSLNVGGRFRFDILMGGPVTEAQMIEMFQAFDLAKLQGWAK